MISFLAYCMILCWLYWPKDLYQQFSGFLSHVLPHSLKTCSTSSPNFKTTDSGCLPLLPKSTSSGSSGGCRECLCCLRSPLLHPSLFAEAGSQGQLEGGLPQHVSQDRCLVGAAPWSRARKIKQLDSNLLCPDLWQELVGRERGPVLTSWLGEHGRCLHFCPSCGHLSAFFGLACLDLTRTNFRSFVVRPECGVD